jgi:hypothetical protein
VRNITVHISVPEDQYTEALRLVDTLEYLTKHPDPSLLYTGLPTVPGLTLYVVADELRPDIEAQMLPSLLRRYNSNMVMLRPANA